MCIGTESFLGLFLWEAAEHLLSLPRLNKEKCLSVKDDAVKQSIMHSREDTWRHILNNVLLHKEVE